MSVYFKNFSIVLILLLNSVVLAAPKSSKEIEARVEKESDNPEEIMDDVNSKIEQHIKNKAARKFVAREGRKDQSK